MKELSGKLLRVFLVFMLLQSVIVSIYFFITLRNISNRENERYYHNYLIQQISNADSKLLKVRNLYLQFANNAEVRNILLNGIENKRSGEYVQAAMELDSIMTNLLYDSAFIDKTMIFPDYKNPENYYYYESNYVPFRVDARDFVQSGILNKLDAIDNDKIYYGGIHNFKNRFGQTKEMFYIASKLGGMINPKTGDAVTLIFFIDKDVMFPIADNNTLLYIDDSNGVCRNMSNISAEYLSITEKKNELTLGTNNFSKSTVFYEKSEILGWNYYLYVEKTGFSKSMILLYLIFIIVIAAFSIIFMLTFRRFSSKILQPINDVNMALKDISENRFDVRLPVESGSEFASVCEHVNITAQRISEYIGVIKERTEKERMLQMKVLQYQINPHFIYNTIATIRSNAIINNDEAVAEDLKLFSGMLRDVLSVNGKLITLEEELEFIKRYIYFHKLRSHSEITERYDIEFALMKFKVPNLILQPIVENSLLHGLNMKLNMHEQAVIEIKAYTDEKNIIISITDNGCGMSEESINEHLLKSEENKNSIGLINVRDRLKLIYGNDSRMEIKSKEGVYTEIRLIIKKPTEYDEKRKG